MRKEIFMKVINIDTAFIKKGINKGTPMVSITLGKEGAELNVQEILKEIFNYGLEIISISKEFTNFKYEPIELLDLVKTLSKRNYVVNIEGHLTDLDHPAYLFADCLDVNIDCKSDPETFKTLAATMLLGLAKVNKTCNINYNILHKGKNEAFLDFYGIMQELGAISPYNICVYNADVSMQSRTLSGEFLIKILD